MAIKNNKLLRWSILTEEDCEAVVAISDEVADGVYCVVGPVTTILPHCTEQSCLHSTR